MACFAAVSEAATDVEAGAKTREFRRPLPRTPFRAPRRLGLIAAVSAQALAVAQLAVADSSVTKRLHIKNGCDREPIWIAHEAGADIGEDAQNIRIGPGEEFHFATPPGLMATRYWPKMGCDEDGNHCNIGGSGGPGLSCVRRPPEVEEDDYSRCAPPVDTKFEGSFDSNGFDFVDMSLVDGWTLPFKLELNGECSGQWGQKNNLVIDCSGLSLGLCPKAEELSAAGITVDLRAINPHTKEVAGCYAPCMKLVSGKWNNSVSKGRHHEDPEVAPYCCPTPPETPEACRTGPIKDTSFLDVVHSKCPGVYGYAYDDGMGLLQCSPASTYDLTFYCPDARTDGPTFTETTTLAVSDTKAKVDCADLWGQCGGDGYKGSTQCCDEKDACVHEPLEDYDSYHQCRPADQVEKEKEQAAAEKDVRPPWSLPDSPTKGAEELTSKQKQEFHQQAVEAHVLVKDEVIAATSLATASKSAMAVSVGLRSRADDSERGGAGGAGELLLAKVEGLATFGSTAFAGLATIMVLAGVWRSAAGSNRHIGHNDGPDADGAQLAAAAQAEDEPARQTELRALL